MSKKVKNRVENLYDYLTNEEDARACTEISDEACRYVPNNFFLIIISNTLTKIGDSLSNPKTVLAWLMTFVNAPVYLIGFLVPIRESGSMLPQILIAGYVRRLRLRKWVWVTGAVLQFLSITAIGLVAYYFAGVVAGWLIIFFLILFSLSRGLSSIASKDVLGKTIPKKRRGRLNGYSTAISGFFVLLTGLYLMLRSKEDIGIAFYSGLIFFSAALWLLGALVYSRIKEYPGETSGGKNALGEAFEKFNIVKKDKAFRNFLIARSLLLCSALTAPFYVVLATANYGTKIYVLGLFILANGIASSISAQK